MKTLSQLLGALPEMVRQGFRSFSVTGTDLAS